MPDSSTRYKLLIILLFLISVSTARAFQGSAAEPVHISIDSLNEGSIQILPPFRHHMGDIEGAHVKDFDDSNWEVVSDIWLTPDEVSEDWDRIRWFRVYISADSTLKDVPVSLTHNSLGAREIWYNGKLIDSHGVVTTDKERYEAPNMRGWTVFVPEADTVSVLAIRMAFNDYERLTRLNVSFGIALGINQPERSSNYYLDTYRFASGVTWFMVGLSLVFSILHLFFYLYNTKLSFNLWFSLACLSYAIGTWGQGQWAFNEAGATMVLIQMGFQSLAVLTFLFLGLFMRSVMDLGYPVYFKILAWSMVGVAVLNFTEAVPLIAILILVVIYSIEIFVIAVQGILRKKKGAWFISGGIATFIGSIFLVVGLELLGYFGGFNELSIFHAPYAGFIIAMVGMSLYQSRHLADLDIENKRKSLELEKARELQVSLLPAKLPVKEDYAISVAMYTATEVGGDYYDYIEKNDGGMIWAMGDATGHGTEAGIVAAMTKTLFLTLAPKLSPDDCLREMSLSLKQTGVRKKYMCMGLLTVNGKRVSWCAAGIPAALIVRKDPNRSVEQLESKGMPLGSVLNYQYQISKSELNSGDLLILMSDGLLEQMNSSREEFGIDRVIEILDSNRGISPDKMITKLKKGVDRWRGDLPLHDDVSLVCLKRK